MREKVLAHVNNQDFSQAINLHIKMLDTIKEEQMMAPLGEHYEIIARLYKAVGDWQNTLKWAELAVEDLEIYGGKEVYEQIYELENFIQKMRRLKK